MRLSEILHQEHQRTLIALDDLDQWRDRPMPNHMDDINDLLTRLIDVCESDVTRHYAFEEENLFPILRQNGADFMANMLSGEHTIIRPIAQELCANATQSLKDGFTLESWQRFQELSFEFIGHETFHIQKEEMGLINALNMMLTPEVEASLIALYQA